MKRVNRTFAVFMTICAVFFASGSFVFAEERTNETTLDYSRMSMEDILKIRSDIEAELYKRGSAVVILAGEYIVGKDIAAGSYDLSSYNGNEDYDSLSWNIRVYRGSESKTALAQARDQNWNANRAADKAKAAGEEATYPDDVDYSSYLVLDKGFRNTESVRIRLEEGQVMELHYDARDKSNEVVISKATSLFMD